VSVPADVDFRVAAERGVSRCEADPPTRRGLFGGFFVEEDLNFDA